MSVGAESDLFMKIYRTQYIIDMLRLFRVQLFSWLWKKESTIAMKIFMQQCVNKVSNQKLLCRNDLLCIEFVSLKFKFSFGTHTIQLDSWVAVGWGTEQRLSNVRMVRVKDNIALPVWSDNDRQTWKLLNTKTVASIEMSDQSVLWKQETCSTETCLR